MTCMTLVRTMYTTAKHLPMVKTTRLMYDITLYGHLQTLVRALVQLPRYSACAGTPGPLPSNCLIRLMVDVAAGVPWCNTALLYSLLQGYSKGPAPHGPDQPKQPD